MGTVPAKELRKIPLFSRLAESVVTGIAAIVRRREYDDGEEIFAEGSPGDAFFVVISGEVVIRKALDAQQTRVKELAAIETGDFFGELSLFDTLTRSAQAVARGRTAVYEISRDDFQKLIRSSPEVAVEQLLSFVRTLGQRLRATNNHLAVIYELGVIISNERTLEGLAARVLAQITALFDEPVRALVALWNPFNEEFYPAAEAGGMPPEVCGLGWAADPAWRAMLDSAVDGCVIDPGADARVPGPVRALAPPARSLLVAPLCAAGREHSGFILLASGPQQEAFTTTHRMVVAAIASLLSLAVVNVWHAQEEAARERLAASRGRASW